MRKTISRALTALLSFTIVLSLSLPASAMDFGFAALAFDAPAYAQAATQQVELTVKLAEMQAAQTPVVSEGGGLNGGTGDINTIIVQGSSETPIVGFEVGKDEVWAANYSQIDDNYGRIAKNTSTGIVIYNNETGKIGQNFGTVRENYGRVQENSGMIERNIEGGTVNSSTGTVELNYGTVKTNKAGGTIEYSYGVVTINDGTIESVVAGTAGTNNGVIEYVERTGTVDLNSAEGIIQMNFGIVKENLGTVDNYADDDGFRIGIVELNRGIVFNYGGTVTDNQGTELFQVTINRGDNTSVTDAANGLVAHNGEAWKEQGNTSSDTATVTISPADGYTITNIAEAEGISPVKNADGSWTVTVNAGLVNEGKFSLDTSVSKTDSSDRYPPYNGGDNRDPYYHGGQEQYFADILSLLDITMEPAATATGYNAGPNAYDSFYSDKIAELSSAAENGVVEIDLRQTGWTTLKRGVFEAAAARGDVTIIIYYNHWGRDYTLTIPAGTDLSAVTGGAQFLEASQLPALLGIQAV
ncbi:MAG: hypothetical protein IJG40_16645 [Oscillospiraceae bacterium]|nr:hypothetical protein [Oscillospiraceae bacterium]